MRTLTISLLIILGSLLTAWGGSVHVSVVPPNGKRNIEVGDLFYIEITVSNLEGSPAKPGQVPGANVAYFDRTSSSTSMTVVNGVATRRTEYTWTTTCRAKQEGSYSFGPVTVAGVKSNVAHYSIGKTSASPRQGAAAPAPANADDNDGKPKYIGRGDQNLFLRANVTKTSAFEQEAIVYTVKLYTSYDAVKFIGATSAPKFDGFVVEESKDISQSLTIENYQGRSYATAVIARYIIFPQMTGNLKVQGNTYTISVDRREYYHDPFFGNLTYSDPLQLNVTPNDLEINVKPLPQPKPADFCGGVGRFAISSQLRGKEFKTNQTNSIVYTVTGTGNLKYVQLPDLASLYPPQLEIYTPSVTQDVNVGSSNVSGKVTFDYSFMPTEEGTFKIPDVTLTYFNPESERYETSTAKGYIVTVGKGEGSAKSQTKKRMAFEPELEPVKVSALKKTHVPDIRKGIYWLWFILPGAALVCSLAGYYIYQRQHADMAAFNSRRADKLARRRLRRAAAAMKKHDRELFYDELLKALWGYLGDKLKMPTSELMRDNIRQKLDARDIPQQVTDRLIRLIDEAEFAKYSSAGASQDMGTDYKEAIASINELEKSFKN